MSIKKTYIPAKPRSSKLVGTSMSGGVAGGVSSSSTGSTDPNSHTHHNKRILDTITQEMLDNALREMLGVESTEEITDENYFSALRTIAEIVKNNEVLKDLFLSKTNNDTARGFIQFLQGISVEELATLAQGLEIGDYTPGLLGSGASLKMKDGISELEVDKLTVRMVATFFEIVVSKISHIGGQLLLTPARMKCVRVVEGDTFYKCYFDTGDGEVSNEFVAGDFARCQVFTGSGTKFYWRLVTLVGEDWINLSKTSAAVGSDAPEAGDDITQLGNATDTSRQSAIILSTVGIDAPSWKQYSGINSFSLEGKETTIFSKLGNRISGETVFTSGGANLDDHLEGVAQDMLDALKAAQDAEDKAQQAIEDAEANVVTINTEVGKLQEQLDGEVSNWFYPYTPTLSNYPASDWTDNTIKDRHIGDTFTNTAQAPATDAGKSWRFVKNGSTYSWTAIADSDAVKALLEASKAQATADGKSTTHLLQPTKYSLGDMWVLNADQTVNGTAYKQGEILTATQDSVTYNQAHWIKRVRYTDDSAVDNLEIGGRNLVLNSEAQYGLPRYAWSETYYLNEELEVGQEYTFSIDFLSDGDLTTLSLRPSDGVASEKQQNVGLFGKNKVTFTVTKPNLILFRVYKPNGTDVTFDIGRIKIEKGNKATDWTPAPEDVDASIKEAKDSVTALDTYVDGAFKDGLITQAEAKSIEKYLNSVDESMAQTEGIYDSVKSNTLLIDKSPLTNAFNALDVAKEALKTAINTAIADGKTTITEKNNVDAKFIIFNEKMKLFQIAIGNAEKAIQVEQKRLSDEKVDNLEIGGRNLLISESVRSYQGNPIDVVDGFYCANTGLYGGIIFDKFKLESGNDYVISFEYYTTDNSGWYSITNAGLIAGEAAYGSNVSLNLIQDGNVHKKVIKISATETKEHKLSLLRAGSTGSVYYKHNSIKVEKGTKATDWSPAPEDVQADIDGLGDYMEGAFQDSVIDKAEAKAIGEHLKTINDRYVTDNALYNNLIANPFLKEGAVRTTLQNVMQNIYRRDKPLLETAINNIVNNKTVTTPLRTAFNTAFANYRLAITDFQTAVENARKAIEEQRVDAIPYEGRNLLTGTKDELAYVNRSGWADYQDGNTNHSRLVNLLQPSETYTLRVFLDARNSDYPVSMRIRLPNETNPYRDFQGNLIEAGKQGYSTVTFVMPSDATSSIILMFRFNQSGTPTQNVGYGKAKLEKGTKATDWTLAPEDVQAEIDEAKKAGTDASAEVVTMGNSLTTMVNTVTGALEDKVIDEAERKTLIAEQKTLDTEQARLLALVNSLLGSAYLVGNANATLSDASNATLKASTGTLDVYQMTIDVMINADKITEAMISAYEGAYDNHKDGLSSLNVAIENARKAIDIEVKRLSDEKVDDIEIGGRNYILESLMATHSNFTTGFDSKGKWYQFNAGGRTVTNLNVFEAETSYVLSFEFAPVDGSNGIVYFMIRYTDGTFAANLSNTHSPFVTNPNKTVRRVETVNYIPGVVRVYNLKLEKGNKATDWTPAPEDVQASIDKVQADANVSLAKTKGFTKIGDVNFEDGLIFTSLIKLLDAGNDGDEMAGISGIAGDNKEDPAFWAGGTYDQAIGGTAKAIIRHDGSSKFTDTEITGTVNATSGSFKGQIEATEGSLGGMTIAGDMLTSKNGRVVIDGKNEAIYLLDENGSTKTVIKSANLPSLSSYFSNAFSQTVSMSPLAVQLTEYQPTAQTSSISIPEGSYEAVIPQVTMTVYANSLSALGGGGQVRLELVYGGKELSLGAVTAWASGQFGEDTQTVTIPAMTVPFNGGGNVRLRVSITNDSIGESAASVSGSVSTSGNFGINAVVNRSEIGNNGMMIATSKTNYDYMVGGTHEVRRGQVIFRVTDAGIRKSTNAGSNWENI